MKVLFYTVPVGSLIRFNGCKAEKLSETHVRFLEDADGNPIDYTHPSMAGYYYSTCEAIGGTPVTVLSEPSMIETTTYILPVYWASYLINGDGSGLVDGEQEAIDVWLQSHGSPHFVDVGEPYFSWRNDATTLGGDVAEYTALSR